MKLLGESWAAHPVVVRAASVAMMALFAMTAGCTPEIGDECDTALDCSTLGDRLCDITQPDGYCTIFNCEPDGCPDEAACVAFNGELDPACGTADDSQFGRFASTFCMKVCEEQGDCRPGYECVRPNQRFARVVDLETETSNPQDTMVCLAIGETPKVPDEPPGACYPGETEPLVPYTPATGGAGTGGTTSSGTGGMASGGTGGMASGGTGGMASGGTGGMASGGTGGMASGGTGGQGGQGGGQGGN